VARQEILYQFEQNFSSFPPRLREGVAVERNLRLLPRSGECCG
jgi:hypothetical protein